MDMINGTGKKKYEKLLNFPDNTEILNLFYKYYKNYDIIEKQINLEDQYNKKNNKYYIYNKFNLVKLTSTGCWVWECPK